MSVQLSVQCKVKVRICAYTRNTPNSEPTKYFALISGMCLIMRKYGTTFICVMYCDLWLDRLAGDIHTL